MKGTKIDWCDATVNPVVGCPRGCPYCYARRLNDRFGWIKNFEKPTFFPHRLGQLSEKRRRVVFMDSMSDVVFWHLADPSAPGQVLKAIISNPQHKYIFLTKSIDPKSLLPSIRTAAGEQLIYNGLSVDCQQRLDGYKDVFDFLSVEPMLEPIRLPFNAESLKQIIIGAETGRRKGKVLPDKAWVKGLVAQARARGLPVYMKESLRSVMGEDFLQDKLIWQIENKEK